MVSYYVLNGMAPNFMGTVGVPAFDFYQHWLDGIRREIDAIAVAEPWPVWNYSHFLDMPPPGPMSVGLNLYKNELVDWWMR